VNESISSDKTLIWQSDYQRYYYYT